MEPVCLDLEYTRMYVEKNAVKVCVGINKTKQVYRVQCGKGITMPVCRMTNHVYKECRNGRSVPDKDFFFNVCGEQFVNGISMSGYRIIYAENNCCNVHGWRKQCGIGTNLPLARKRMGKDNSVVRGPVRVCTWNVHRQSEQHGKGTSRLLQECP